MLKNSVKLLCTLRHDISKILNEYIRHTITDRRDEIFTFGNITSNEQIS